MYRNLVPSSFLNQLNKNCVYYLASPYTSKIPEELENRFLLVDEIGYELLVSGFTVIEPIASTHYKSKRFKLPTDYQFWQNHCKQLITRADGLIVCMIPGWEQSVGVQDEIKITTSQNKPIHYLCL